MIQIVASPEFLKHRRSLWLRAEQAFGLDSVERSAAVSPAPDAAVSTPIAHPAPVAPIPAKAQSMPLQQFTTFQPELISAPAFGPVLSKEEKIAALAKLNETVKACIKCRLHETRTQTVFGEGDPDAKIFFIGEGPGENEDLQGRPFVGRAGELLNKMIAGMGLRREQVFIANIVKCRPPQNRVPAPDEVDTCTSYLVKQLEIVRPQVIITLGLPSSRYMLQNNLSMGKMRGQWHNWRGIKLMPTFHPAYLLRSYTPENRAMVWSDLQAVMKEVGLPIPARSRS